MIGVLSLQAGLDMNRVGLAVIGWKLFSDFWIHGILQIVAHILRNTSK